MIKIENKRDVFLLVFAAAALVLVVFILMGSTSFGQDPQSTPAFEVAKKQAVLTAASFAEILRIAPMHIYSPCPTPKEERMNRLEDAKGCYVLDNAMEDWDLDLSKVSSLRVHLGNNRSVTLSANDIMTALEAPQP